MLASFFIHRSIQAFAADIVARYGTKDSKAFLFPTRKIAARCVCFVKSRASPEIAASLNIVHLVLDTTQPTSDALATLSPAISAVTCSQEAFPILKQYWQHSGDGVSSRRAEFCHALFKDGLLRLDEGPATPVPASPKPCTAREPENNAREEEVPVRGIFNSHRALLGVRGSMKSIEFGFAYVDTKDPREVRLEGGERFLALFCEFPSNPLIACPNLVRIRQLADKYDFAVWWRRRTSTCAPFADIVVSSLTKIFSGDCNVMGGSAIFNPNSRYYAALKTWARTEYEDTYWPEDVMFLERNSRDLVSRVDRINTNAEAICDVLRASPLVKSLFYPKFNPSRANYEACKLPTGGWGGLLSVVLHNREQAVAFYDAVDTAKGPSLGTNFTLTSPYVLLAHYGELDWAETFGVERDLIRISVGLEETEHIVNVFKAALKAAEANTGSQN
ncbi:hypothetical protein NEMBOFW57_010464 [Staphylotrichum longicolle]|uniref:Cystathionine gamma-synthase n=1 Tax=Staphylotrichum longicolle TaxID=669026 RepID=A0AAD4HX11_9PEZI|nr:hypothetical protein NEMBOFW57_010464 [Staphylotrichum longicolle]